MESETENPSSLAPLLTTEEVAMLFGCSPRWLHRLRTQQMGPPFVRIGALVRYRTDDVERFLDQHSVATNSGSPASPVPPEERTDIASRVTPGVAAA